MKKKFNKKIYVAGHLGMVGSSIVELLNLKDIKILFFVKD